MRLSILLVILLTTGCAYVDTITPPYADPRTGQDYSVIRVHEPNTPFMSLSTLDGVYGSESSFNGPRDVYEMKVIPGLHVIKAYCSVINYVGYTKGLGMQFELDFEPNKKYVLSCISNEDDSAAKFMLTESGQKVDFKVLKLLSPGGGDYKKGL